MDYFKYRGGRETMGNVIPFIKPKDDRTFEHVDSTTIVERVEMTDEMKQAFEDLGFNMEDTK